MHALVYQGSGQFTWDQVADPQIIDDTDAIVGIDTVTICGTDLPGEPVRPMPVRRRVGARPHDRRGPGRVRTGPVLWRTPAASPSVVT